MASKGKRKRNQREKQSGKQDGKKSNPNPKAAPIPLDPEILESNWLKSQSPGQVKAWEKEKAKAEQRAAARPMVEKEQRRHEEFLRRKTNFTKEAIEFRRRIQERDRERSRIHNLLRKNNFSKEAIQYKQGRYREEGMQIPDGEGQSWEELARNWNLRMPSVLAGSRKDRMHARDLRTAYKARRLVNLTA